MSRDLGPLDMNEDGVLELPRTRLRVLGGELQRFSDKGIPTMRLPLREIETVDFISWFDPISFVFLLTGVGLAGVGYYVSEHYLLTALLYVGAILLGGLCLFSMKGYRIIIQSTAGVTRIPCLDDVDVGEGFVNSLRANFRIKGNAGV